MSDNNRRDGFIPNNLLKKLAERGNENAKKTLIKTEEIKNKAKEEKKNNITASLTQANRQESSKRLIYDSQGTEEFKHKLVRKEGEPPVSDEIANIAYDFCGKTLEYLRNILGRNSIDGNGMDVICNIHFAHKYNNAFWIGEGNDANQLAIGDGDGETFINLARSIDVVAHELGHAVTQFTNELEYKHQSGALNEHFSDVIGSAVKQFVKGQNAQTADWLIGDEIVGSKFPGKALRSMKDPGTANELDDQVANMKDYVELPESDDNGGVHKYSGIFNKAFFLVSQKIGTDLAVFLWYNALKNKEIIHLNATFDDAFRAIMESSKILVQQGKLPQDTTSIVENAFEEVGIYALATV